MATIRHRESLSSAAFRRRVDESQAQLTTFMLLVADSKAADQSITSGSAKAVAASRKLLREVDRILWQR